MSVAGFLSWVAHGVAVSGPAARPWSMTGPSAGYPAVTARAPRVSGAGGGAGPPVALGTGGEDLPAAPPAGRADGHGVEPPDAGARHGRAEAGGRGPDGPRERGHPNRSGRARSACSGQEAA